MTNPEIRYCPRCGCGMYRAERMKDGSMGCWCSECEHLMEICDHGSDPLMDEFDRRVGV